MGSVAYGDEFLKCRHVEKVSEEFFSENVEVAEAMRSCVQRQTRESHGNEARETKVGMKLRDET